MTRFSFCKKKIKKTFPGWIKTIHFLKKYVNHCTLPYPYTSSSRIIIIIPLIITSIIAIILLGSIMNSIKINAWPWCISNRCSVGYMHRCKTNSTALEWSWGRKTCRDIGTNNWLASSLEGQEFKSTALEWSRWNGRLSMLVTPTWSCHTWCGNAEQLIKEWVALLGISRYYKSTLHWGASWVSQSTQVTPSSL